MMTKKHMCPVCGRYEFEEEGSFDICEVCGWEDDNYQERHPDYVDGANHISLNQARILFLELGVCKHWMLETGNE